MAYKAIRTQLKLNQGDHDFLLYLMRAAKNLYNQALYNARQHFFNTKKHLKYEDNYQLLKHSEHYRILNTSQGQAVIKKVDEAMKAFFGSLKSKQVTKVRLPRYLKKDGYYPLIDRAVYKPDPTKYHMPRGQFIKRVSKLFRLPKPYHDNQSLFSSKHSLKELSIHIETPKCIHNKKIKEITIKPLFDGQYIEVIHVYVTTEKTNKQSEANELMGIDLGYNNLAMCALTTKNHLLIDGKKLKSYNQWYHKRMAHLKRVRHNQKQRTKQMNRLEMKRKNQMRYGIFKAARLIINHAIYNNVGKITIGYNDSFKDITLNKQYNQMAKSIPLAKLRDRIIYLCEENNITHQIVNEAYTSKASYLDQDDLPTLSRSDHVFSGKRIKRGLYRTKNGYLINADLNAALNILQKGNPDTERLGYSGVNTPKRTYLFA